MVMLVLASSQQRENRLPDYEYPIEKTQRPGGAMKEMDAMWWY